MYKQVSLIYLPFFFHFFSLNFKSCHKNSTYYHQSSSTSNKWKISWTVLNTNLRCAIIDRSLLDSREDGPDSLITGVVGVVGEMTCCVMVACCAVDLGSSSIKGNRTIKFEYTSRRYTTISKGYIKRLNMQSQIICDFYMSQTKRTTGSSIDLSHKSPIELNLADKNKTRQHMSWAD